MFFGAFCRGLRESVVFFCGQFVVVKCRSAVVTWLLGASFLGSKIFLPGRIFLELIPETGMGALYRLSDMGELLVS
jgi:hypothetical protein